MSSLQRISITAMSALVFGIVGASAGELPQYEVAGFPITPLQMSVLKSSRVEEQSPRPTLTLDGMSASPHQIVVIGPRTKRHIAKKMENSAGGAIAARLNRDSNNGDSNEPVI